MGLTSGGGRLGRGLLALPGPEGGENSPVDSVDELKLDSDVSAPDAPEGDRSGTILPLLRPANEEGEFLSRDEPKMARCKRGEPSNVFCIFPAAGGDKVGLEGEMGDAALRLNLGEANSLKIEAAPPLLAFDSGVPQAGTSRFISNAASRMTEPGFPPDDDPSSLTSGKFIGW